MAKLSSNSELTLVMGRDIVDGQPFGQDEPRFGPDFTIVGAVLSSTPNDSTNGCTGGAGGVGGVEVRVSEDGDAPWHLLGVWTSETNKFDIACAQLGSILWIRLTAQPGADAVVDTVTPEENACLATE